MCLLDTPAQKPEQNGHIDRQTDGPENHISLPTTNSLWGVFCVGGGGGGGGGV